MFGSIQTTLIAIAVAMVIASVGTFGVTYKFVSSHYKEQIATTAAISAKALQQATDNVLIAERKNNDITNELNKKALEQDKQLAAAQVELSGFHTSNNGLLLANSRCRASKPVTNSPSVVNPTGDSSTTEGMCELPELLATRITETAIAADKFRNLAITCKAYADAIATQREQMSKPQ